MALNISDKINPFLAAGRTLDRLVSAGSIGDFLFGSHQHNVLALAGP